jgi:hypothetical protein
VPHRDRDGERLGAAGQQPGLTLGEDVDVGGATAVGPGERRPEAATGIVLDEHPHDGTLDQRRAGRERRRGTVDLAPDVVADERAQFEGAQPPAPVGLALDGGYFFVAFRVP